MSENEKPLEDLEGGTNVSEQYRNYITRNIKSLYKKKIIPPLIFLAFIIAIFFISPVYSMLTPINISSSSSIKETYKQNKYVNATLNDLYFTGYTKKWLNKTQGYYYYTVMDDNCVIVLMSPETCKHGEPQIPSTNFKAKIIKNGNTEEDLLNNLANDLKWSYGITNSISSYALDEPDANDFLSYLLIILVVVFGIISLIICVIYALYILFPTISLPVWRLKAYGNSKKLLAQAENEIATLPQLATEDMFITKNFFIETSKYGVAIIPIKEIIWIYKYSTLHKFLWHHFSISYTLHITAKKRQYIKCPKNIKSDIDGVMEYLSEANHNILVGFNEENRLKVKEIQGDFRFIKNWYETLKKDIKKYK